MAKLSNKLFGRRLWAVLIAAIMILQLLPVAVLADESDVIEETVEAASNDEALEVVEETIEAEPNDEAEVPAEEPAEEPEEVPAEEDPAEEPAEDPAEDPAEEPVEELAEVPAEEPAEEPEEEPAEELAEVPAEEPAEEPEEVPAEEPAEDPAEDPAEEAVRSVETEEKQEAAPAEEKKEEAKAEDPEEDEVKAAPAEEKKEEAEDFQNAKAESKEEEKAEAVPAESKEEEKAEAAPAESKEEEKAEKEKEQGYYIWGRLVGVGEEAIPPMELAKAYYAGEIVKLGHATFGGYDFVGYYLVVDDGYEEITDPDHFIMPAHDVTIERRYVKNSDIAVWVQVVSSPATFTYDGQEHTNTFTVKYFVDGEEVDALPEGFTLDYDRRDPKIFDEVPLKRALEASKEVDLFLRGVNAGDYRMLIVPYLRGEADGYYIAESKDAEVTMTITPRPVTVTVAWPYNEEFTYDGWDHWYYPEITFEDELFYLDALVWKELREKFAYCLIDATAEPVMVGESWLGENWGLLDKNFTVSYNCVQGAVKINPAPLTVWTESATKAYDGKPLTAPGIKVSGIVGEDVLRDCYTTGSQTDPGSSPNTYEIIWAETHVAAAKRATAVARRYVSENNYYIAKEELGTLTVLGKKEVLVVVTGASYAGVYDGLEHTAIGFTVEVKSYDNSFGSGSVLFNGVPYLKAEMPEISRTNAGTTEMGLSEEMFSFNAEGYTVYYEIHDGFVTVDPRLVTVYIGANNDVQVYDGTEKTMPAYNAWKEDLVEPASPRPRDEAKKEATRAPKPVYDLANVVYADDYYVRGTEIGLYERELTIDQFSNTDPNWEVDFRLSGDPIKRIIVEPGKPIAPITSTLRVIQPTVTVHIKGVTERLTYDGKEHTLAVDKDGNLLVDGENKGSAFTFGDISIPDGVDYTRKEILDLIYVRVPFEVSGTNVDKYIKNGWTQNLGNKDQEVRIQYIVDEPMVLVIEPRELTLVVDDIEVYWGQHWDWSAHFEGELAEGDSYPVHGQNYELWYDHDLWNEESEIGTHQIEVDLFNIPRNIRENYEISISEATITIKPLPIKITVKGNKATYAYDERMHYADGFSMEAALNGVELEDTWYANDLCEQAKRATLTKQSASVAGTDPDTYYMGLKASGFWCDDNCFDVTYEVEDGWLKILPEGTELEKITLHVIIDSAEYTYDGEYHPISWHFQEEGYTVLESEPDSYVFIGSYYYRSDEIPDIEHYSCGGKGVRDAGKYVFDRFDSKYVYNADGEDVRARVSFEVVTPGTIVINKAKATVRISCNQSKVMYNGKGQSVKGFSWELDEDFDGPFFSSGNIYYDPNDYSSGDENMAMLPARLDSMSVRGTEVGTYQLNLKAVQLFYNDKNYDVTFIVEQDMVLEIVDKMEGQVTLELYCWGWETAAEEYKGVIRQADGKNFHLHGVISEGQTEDDLDLHPDGMWLESIYGTPFTAKVRGSDGKLYTVSGYTGSVNLTYPGTKPYGISYITEVVNEDGVVVYTNEPQGPGEWAEPDPGDNEAAEAREEAAAKRASKVTPQPQVKDTFIFITHGGRLTVTPIPLKIELYGEKVYGTADPNMRSLIKLYSGELIEGHSLNEILFGNGGKFSNGWLERHGGEDVGWYPITYWKEFIIDDPPILVCEEEAMEVAAEYYEEEMVMRKSVGSLEQLLAAEVKEEKVLVEAAAPAAEMATAAVIEKHCISEFYTVEIVYETVKTITKDNGYTRPYFEDLTDEPMKNLVGWFRITPAPLTITAHDNEKELGEDDPELTYTVRGLVADEHLPKNYVGIERDKAGTEEGEKVGAYDIEVFNMKTRKMLGFKNAAAEKKYADEAFKPEADLEYAELEEAAAEIIVQLPEEMGGSGVFKETNYDIIYIPAVLKIKGEEVEPTPSEELSEEPTETPAAEEPTEEPTETPAAEEPTETPAAEEPTETPAAEDPTPTAEPTAAPAPETTPTAEPSEEPAEEPTEEPAEEPAEEPTEEPTQQSATTIIENKTPTSIIGAFSLIHISDMFLDGEGVRSDAYGKMTAWIAENYEALGVIAVAGSGNLVDKPENEAAWKLAKKHLMVLPKALPYYDVAGSADVNGDALLYDAYITNNLCEASPKREYDDGQIWYEPIEDVHLLLVGIGYEKLAETEEEQARQEEWIKFVNDAIAQYPDYGVVLVMNSYIDANAKLTAFGELVEKEIVQDNETVCLILCGGAEGTARLEKTYGEHKVNAVMYNYSSDEEKGLGFLRVITFNGEERSITVASYNAVTEATEYDEAHPEYDNFVIENAF